MRNGPRSGREAAESASRVTNAPSHSEGPGKVRRKADRLSSDTAGAGPAASGNSRPFEASARSTGPVGPREADRLLIPSFRPDGSCFDLADVQPGDIVWTEIANALSGIARFNNRYRDAAYSVAQHCVMGADALYAETGDPVCAGYFLLHDAHEALTGDITRPMVMLIEHHRHAAERRDFPRLAISGNTVKDAVEAAKAGIDGVVWSVAGLPPIGKMPLYARQVSDMDERMLRAEAIVLFGRAAASACPAADLPPPRLTGAIRPWGAVKAEIAWLDRLEKYLGIVARVG